jgi:hypothetical protein
MLDISIYLNLFRISDFGFRISPPPRLCAHRASVVKSPPPDRRPMKPPRREDRRDSVSSLHCNRPDCLQPARKFPPFLVAMLLPPSVSSVDSCKIRSIRVHLWLRSWFRLRCSAIDQIVSNPKKFQFFFDFRNFHLFEFVSNFEFRISNFGFPAQFND